MESLRLEATLVPGTIKVVGAVTVSPRPEVESVGMEVAMAHPLGDEYWLYMVENAAENPTLHRIRNPAAVLQPEEKVEVVRYIVRDWQSKLADDV